MAERRLELNPDDARALYLGASALILLGDLARGRAWIERAPATDPDDTGALYNVACGYALLGEPDAAVACLEKADQDGFGHREWLEKFDRRLATRESAIRLPSGAVVSRASTRG